MNDINQFLMSHGGPLLFAVVFAEQAGLPLPAAPWLLAAGALAAGGELNPVAGIGITALAAVIADSIWFYVGRRGGQRVLHLFCRLSLARNCCVGRSQNLFARHGLRWIVAAKFLPGLGAVMPPLAGTLGMKTGRFLLFDSLGSLIYATFYIVTGFVFHNQLGQAMGVLNQFGMSALMLGLLLAIGYLGFKYLRRRSRTEGNTRPETVWPNRQLSNWRGRHAGPEAALLADRKTVPSNEDSGEAIEVAIAKPPSLTKSRSANTISVPEFSLALVTAPSDPISLELGTSRTS